MVEKVPEFSAESLCLRQGMVTVAVGVTISTETGNVAAVPSRREIAQRC